MLGCDYGSPITTELPGWQEKQEQGRPKDEQDSAKKNAEIGGAPPYLAICHVVDLLN